MTSTVQIPPPVTRAPRTRGQRSSFARKAVAVFVMLVGATFIAMTLVVNLFSVGPAFERLTDGFRPVMTQQSLSTAREDISRLDGAGTELRTTLLPALASQLRLTPQQMNTMLQTQYPAVAAGVGALPTIVPSFNGLVTTLDQQRDLFASADAIPTKDLPATTLPWALLVTGVVVFGLGIYTWFAPRAGAVVAVVVGAVLIAVPLILSLPQKAADADQLNANLKPVYTQQLITQAGGALTTLSAMGTQMQTKMLPDLATQLKMSPATLQAYLGKYFPNTAAALNNLPASLGRFQNLVATFRGHLSDYNTLKPVELAPIVWTMIAGGIALMLIGGLGAWASRPRLGSIT
ncbi:MAG: hypothetical protein QOC82_2075 [Frankiaceae bacterium]|jgi:hypothetical protein|nr:hypothetical protein [Frankiaceae bacterium]